MEAWETVPLAPRFLTPFLSKISSRALNQSRTFPNPVIIPGPLSRKQTQLFHSVLNHIIPPVIGFTLLSFNLTALETKPSSQGLFYTLRTNPGR